MKLRLEGLLLILVGFFLGILAVPEARAAHTQAALVLADQTVRPGDTVMAGVKLQMEPLWHTYWRNGGGSGMPTEIEWTLPPGITAGEVQWPLPEKLPADELTTYIYENEVLLMVPLNVAPTVSPGKVKLKGHVKWLECEKVCVPGGSDIEATLTVGADTQASEDADLFKEWAAKMPKSDSGLSAQAHWEKEATADVRPLIIEWTAAGKLATADFFPYGNDQFEVQAAVEVLPTDSGKIKLRKLVKKYEGGWPATIHGLLVERDGNTTRSFETSLTTGESTKAVATGPISPQRFPMPPSAGSGSLLLMLAYAFIGGLILNIMPCVLPVIALKILGFVNQAKEDPARVRKFGLLYAAGVLLSFLALAGLVIGVQSVGHAASWGMQFQNPKFLLLMTILVTLVALNLFGLFEITLSGSLMGAAGNLAAKEGSSGAFFNGVLATALATPCTAPFLGAALGFAFTRPPWVIVCIFLMVGVGLALPYVILSWRPGWLSLLPRPGVWMERFKVAMGFPMLATAVWLFSLAAPNFGEDGELWLAMFLVALAMAAWVWGQFVQRGRHGRGLAMGVTAVILLLGYNFILEKELHWRHPMSQSANGILRNSPDGIEWQAWSPDALKAARMTGRPVLVDFTAKWCLTCQLNKKSSIEIPSVQKKLKEINAIALIENSFVKDAVVVAELNRYQRAGVPLVLVYSGDPNTEPQVLPEFLTPGIMLDALDKAARETSAKTSASVNFN